MLRADDSSADSNLWGESGKFSKCAFYLRELWIEEKIPENYERMQIVKLYYAQKTNYIYYF